MSVVVVLQNHHPKDMKLIQFALRANRINYELFNQTDECKSYLEEQAQSKKIQSHLILTDSDDIDFLKEVGDRFPFCLNAVILGEDLASVFEDENLFSAIHCFIARNDPNYVYFPHQIMGAVQRIVSQDFFGLRHFMHGSYTSTTRIINSTEEARDIDTEIGDYVYNISRNKSMATQVEGICDELIMNAMYDANPKYEDFDRSYDIFLNEEEKIVVNYGCDGRMFAISVTDQFGRLGKGTIFQYLRRCFFEEGKISHGEGGAGLGFFRILNSVNSLVINVKPEKKTEVIGILDISLNRRAFQKIKKSFYYLNIN